MPSYLALNLTCFDIHRLDLFCKKRTLLFCGIVLAMRDKRENADQCSFSTAHKLSMQVPVW